jgi:fructokinase
MAFDPTRAPVVFGEALFDCFPDGTAVLGGAPFNVAWHLAAFGAGPVFVSRVGEDALGARIEAAMREQDMTTAGLQRDPVHPTGTVQVALAAGEPSYDIVAGRAYDFIDVQALPALPKNCLLYHGTLALRNASSAAALEVLRRQTDAVFLDVNLRAPWWSADRVRGLLDSARWVKLNANELELLAPGGDGPEAQAAALIARHGLARVYCTQGADGAFALDARGNIERVRPSASVEVVDAVGAGDGFASMLILGLLRGWPLAETLAYAQEFASAIVGRRGATIHDPAFYAELARQWARSDP